MRLRTSTLPKAFTILSIFLLTLCYLYWSRSPKPATSTTPVPASQSAESTNFTLDHPLDSRHWTKVVWQTSRLPATDLPDEDLGRFRTWTDLNPEYRHEVMTDARMESYVRQKYAGTDMERVYFEVKDYILRSDLIRYLILLADGGVYNDLDVGCEKAIDTWVPKRFKDQAGVILGVEVDNDFGPDGRTWKGGQDLFELVNWTIMAKPGQPFIEFLVKRVIVNLHKMVKEQDTPLSEISFSVQDVLATTGPAALTTAFFDYASNLTSTNVTYKNFTKITEPRLVGEVVILPIHAFGAGHQVEWAGFQQDQRKVLVHHYFKGSWKEDHVWAAPPQKEEDKIPENEKEHRFSGDGKSGTKEEEKEEEEKVVTVEEKVVHLETEHVTATATGSGAVETSNVNAKMSEGANKKGYSSFLEPPDKKPPPSWISALTGDKL
ncbi:MAG: hypothetical protein Q9217_000328 [Psora testacea]